MTEGPRERDVARGFASIGLGTLVSRMSGFAREVLTAAVFGAPKGSVSDPVAHSRKMLEFVEFPIDETVISEGLNTVQLKRLDLARALASNPKMLFLDELAAGLTEGELTTSCGLSARFATAG